MLRQEDGDFGAILIYIALPCFKKENNKNKKTLEV
jgi:hypothetical protein